MHISIEGFDGVGKTTVARLLEAELGFRFIEKPLKYLFDPQGGDTEYIRIRNYFNEVSEHNRALSACFYGLGNLFLYEKFKGENIITDRHILSNYAWSGAPESKIVFDTLYELIGHPDFTFILYANQKTILNRLQKRDRNDSDIKKVQNSEAIYQKMINFAEEKKMPFLRIDSTGESPKEIVQKMVFCLRDKGVIPCPKRA